LGHSGQHKPDIRAPVHGVRRRDSRNSLHGKSAESDRLPAVFIGIHLPGQRQLFLIAQTDDLGGYLFAPAKNGKQQGGKNGDDGDYHQ